MHIEVCSIDPPDVVQGSSKDEQDDNQRNSNADRHNTAFYQGCTHEFRCVNTEKIEPQHQGDQHNDQPPGQSRREYA